MLSSHAKGIAALDETKESSPWLPFRYPIFRALWIATVVSNVGTWMHDAGAAWMMTTLSGSPLFVALIQAATALPMCLLALPAGALADIVDRRHYLMAVQSGMLIVAATLALLSFLEMVTPWILLTLTFGLGIGAALNAPAFQATIPELVPRRELPSAVALNGAGVNVSRAIGPALGGMIIAAAGPAGVFMLNALSFVGILAVIYRWPRTKSENTMPAERLWGAMRVGLQYVWESPPIIAVVFRVLLFFFFASAAWALLPLLARTRLAQGSVGYGILVGCIGVGAVAGALLLPYIRRRISSDHLVTVGTAAFAIATVTLGLSRVFYVACAVALLAGAGWLAVLSTLSVAAQRAVPGWVRARALAVFLVAFFGTMALGSTLWGVAASRYGISVAMSVAAAGHLLGVVCGLRFRIESSDEMDQAPSMHWPAPVLAHEIEPEGGPAMVMVEYRIDRAHSEKFAGAMRHLRRIRRRDGAVFWRLYRDVSEPERFIEYFITPSWIEHLRQHERLTVSDRHIQDRVRAFHLGEEPPKVSHFIAEPLPTEEEHGRS